MQKRIQYIDYIKGFAIFMVVCGHIMERGFSYSEGVYSLLYGFIYSFHLPLFFLGSGLLMTQKLSIYKLLSKSKALLLPFLVVGCSYTILSPQADFHYLFFSQGKNGYWFVFCLCEILIFFFLQQRIAEMIQKITHMHNIFIVEIISFLLIILICGGAYIMLSPYQVGEFLALKRVLAGYPFFIIGSFISQYEKAFQIINNKKFFTCNFILFCLLFYISRNGYSNELLRTFYRIPITFVFYYILKNLRLPQRASTYLNYLGQHSLSIYLFHYFFILYIPQFLLLLKPFSAENDIPLITLIITLYGIIVIVYSLIVDYFISKSEFISFIVLGHRPKKHSIT